MGNHYCRHIWYIIKFFQWKLTEEGLFLILKVICNSSWSMDIFRHIWITGHWENYQRPEAQMYLFMKNWTQWTLYIFSPHNWSCLHICYSSILRRNFRDSLSKHTSLHFSRKKKSMFLKFSLLLEKRSKKECPVGVAHWRCNNSLLKAPTVFLTCLAAQGRAGTLSRDMGSASQYGQLPRCCGFFL